MILRVPPSGANGGSSENVSLGRNNTPMDNNGPLLARMGNAGANAERLRPPAFTTARNGTRTGFRSGDQEIVLSPQIRSFNMGCQLPPATVPAFPAAGTAPGSVSSATGALLGESVGGGAGANDGSTAAAGRRIGSGRLMTREERLGSSWNSDYKGGRDGGDGGYGDPDVEPFNHRGRGGLGSNGPGGMNKPNSRFYRMNDRRDDQESGHRGPGGAGGFNNYRNNGNYGDGGDRGDRGRGGYNRNHRYEQEEPEWFTGGPCSQLDTIELHGFDGPAEGKGGDEGAGGRGKFKRIADVEKEMKTKEDANDRRKKGKGPDEDRPDKKSAAANSQMKTQGADESEGGKRQGSSGKEGFTSAFGPGDEEESALRKMMPTGSSPIKKSGGQMDMRHIEDFLRLEDLLNVSLKNFDQTETSQNTTIDFTKQTTTIQNRIDI